MPELQDLYDINRNFTGEQFYRGTPVPEGRYRLGVQVWIRDDQGQFLLSQRHPCKKKPLFWEPTGGAVDAGEDTRAAGVREVFEEIGVRLNPQEMSLIRTQLCDGIEFLDVYLACWNGSVDELRFQENEVVDARWVSYEEMAALDAQGVLAAEYKELFGYVPNVPAAICAMRMDDYEEMADMWRRMPGMGLNDVDDSPEGIQRFLERNPGMSFVAKTTRGMVGTILGGHDGRRGHLYHAAVLPEMRGLGIGRALANASLDALRRNGVSKVGMQVFVDNETGNRFWEKFGFVDRSDVNYRSYTLVDMNETITH